MRKAGQTEKRDGRVRALHKPHKSNPEHQERAQRENAAPRIDYAEAELFLQPHGHQAAEDTSEVRCQEWHPGE